jgi:hypothetical protein
MYPDRQQDVVDKQPVSLVGIPEGGQQQAPQAGNCGVVNGRAGLIAQIANSRHVGLVSDRVQRHTRQIKKQSVIGLVEESGGISLQVMETNVAGPEVAHQRPSAILPVFVIGPIAEVQSDDKSIFPLKRTGHFQRRIITSNLCDGYISVTQYPRNHRGCVFDSQSLAKPLSITLSHHSIHRRFILLHPAIARAVTFPCCAR